MKQGRIHGYLCRRRLVTAALAWSLAVFDRCWACGRVRFESDTLAVCDRFGFQCLLLDPLCLPSVCFHLYHVYIYVFMGFYLHLSIYYYFYFYVLPLLIGGVIGWKQRLQARLTGLRSACDSSGLKIYFALFAATSKSFLLLGVGCCCWFGVQLSPSTLASLAPELPSLQKPWEKHRLGSRRVRSALG